MKTQTLSRFVIVNLCAAAVSATALAQEPPPDAPSEAAAPPPAALGKGLSAAGLIGNGFEDGVNLGIGARLGYNLERIYLGGTFVYHFGESRDASVLGSSYDVSVNVYYFGGELGYDFAAGPVLIRPYAGFGSGTARACVEDTCDSESRAYIAPGGALLYPVHQTIFVGADARFVIPLDDDENDFDHLALFATLGGYF